LPRYRRLNGHGRRSISDKKSKAELLQMLAEAVRNTQPQPVRNTQPQPVRNTQPQPVRDVQPQTKPKARNTQPAPKRPVKIKRVCR
jgi:hypothetical protein